MPLSSKGFVYHHNCIFAQSRHNRHMTIHGYVCATAPRKPRTRPLRTIVGHFLLSHQQKCGQSAPGRPHHKHFLIYPFSSGPSTPANSCRNSQTDHGPGRVISAGSVPTQNATNAAIVQRMMMAVSPPRCIVCLRFISLASLWLSSA